MKFSRRFLFSVLPLMAVGLAVAWIMVDGTPATGEGDSSGPTPPGRTRSLDRDDPEAVKAGRLRAGGTDAAAREWYGRLLVKYPQMKIVWRDVPDEQNGYLQLVNLAESVESESMITRELREMFYGETRDEVKIRTWLGENKALVARILRMAELPDRSSKGIDRKRGSGIGGMKFSGILNAAARLHLKDGDPEMAFRYLAAGARLGDHLTGIESPGLLPMVIVESTRQLSRQSFIKEMAPLVDSSQLAFLSGAFLRKGNPAGDYRRALIADWNDSSFPLLRELLDERSAGGTTVGDPEAFMDAYTGAMLQTMEKLSAMEDRFDPSSLVFDVSSEGLDPMTTEALNGMLDTHRSVVKGYARRVTRGAMESAAISIMIGSQPAVDPVSGLPFRWDPETRLLSGPGGQEGLESIKVP